MSRTDKDLPYRVAQMHAGTIRHDHRDGRCDAERADHEFIGHLTSHHTLRCHKHDVLECRHDEDGVPSTPGCVAGRRYRLIGDDLVATTYAHERFMRRDDPDVNCACDTVPYISDLRCTYHNLYVFEHPAGLSGLCGPSCTWCHPVSRTMSRSVVRRRLATLRGRLDAEASEDFDLEF